MTERFLIEDKDVILVKEGAAEFYQWKNEETEIPTKAMPVFYNNKMELNRDATNLAVLAYQSIYNQKELVIVDSMAASGITSIRMLKEIDHIKRIYINDLNPIAVEMIKKNLSLNNIDGSENRVEVSRKDANFLCNEIAQEIYINQEKKSLQPNVITIDPFGTPNRYVDSAFKAIRNENGLMCVTATDTAVLFGVKSNACIRKYMAKPLRGEYCKEVGARILVYFLSRIANVNKLGIKPLMTFYSNHFLRVFALTIKNQKVIAENFKNYGYIVQCNNCGNRKAVSGEILKISLACELCGEDKKLDYAGPLWIHDLHDEDFVKKVLEINNIKQYANKNKLEKAFNAMLGELNMPVSYYNVHKLSKELKVPFVPKMESITNAIKEKGYKVSRTHFDYKSIKSDMNVKAIKELILSLTH